MLIVPMLKMLMYDHVYGQPSFAKQSQANVLVTVIETEKNHYQENDGVSKLGRPCIQQ